MSASENQISVYQPSVTVRLDVRLEHGRVCLTQEGKEYGREKKAAFGVGGII